MKNEQKIVTILVVLLIGAILTKKPPSLQAGIEVAFV